MDPVLQKQTVHIVIGCHVIFSGIFNCFKKVVIVICCLILETQPFVENPQSSVHACLWELRLYCVFGNSRVRDTNMCAWLPKRYLTKKYYSNSNDLSHFSGHAFIDKWSKLYVGQWKKLESDCSFFFSQTRMRPVCRCIKENIWYSTSQWPIGSLQYKNLDSYASQHVHMTRMLF